MATPTMSTCWGGPPGSKHRGPEALATHASPEGLPGPMQASLSSSQHTQFRAQCQASGWCAGTGAGDFGAAAASGQGREASQEQAALPDRGRSRSGSCAEWICELAGSSRAASRGSAAPVRAGGARRSAGLAFILLGLGLRVAQSLAACYVVNRNDGSSPGSLTSRGNRHEAELMLACLSDGIPPGMTGKT